MGHLPLPVAEKKPTVGFNCTVDHDCKFIMYVGELFAGRCNDKTKVCFDKYEEKLRTGEFKDVTFNYADANGTTVQRETGSYIICDNGYHNWIQIDLVSL